MKKQYNIPEITIQSLNAEDALCASSDSDDILRESASASIFYDF